MPSSTDKKAMISSTSLDLPEHRAEVRDACLRQEVRPIMMDHLPASDDDAIKASLDMVDEADIYIGVYAFRYGYIPEGHDISITEMEFNRAVERGIPVLVYHMNQMHPVTIDQVETGPGAEKLKQFKERASKGRIHAEFKSPEDLRGHVIHGLAELKKREEAESEEEKAPSFHPPNVIPKAPETYIAHPYSLLQTSEVVGRQEELNLLTHWVANPRHEAYQARVFNLVAIGGMGKSAVTWKWFKEVAPNEMTGLAGRMWWSFYESDARYENFIIRALAYGAGKTEEEVRKIAPPEREDELWQLLDQKPFLLILDGLERILIAYARMDAAQMLDDDLDEETANRVVAAAYGIPDDVRETYLEKHRLRMTADPRAGQFLRRLSQVRASRILVTTRLFPADLQTQSATPWPGCYASFLRGLTDDDAINLWRAFGVSGSSEQLLPLFRSFENYPLLLRALAGEVAEYRPAPGDFDEWKTAHSDFDPASLALKNAKTHVLEFAMKGLEGTPRRVLHTIAAFRMPATWETIQALHIGDGKACGSDRDLDQVLTELEDRGLLGWDKRANRYDLHPIVRGVVWQALDGRSRQGIFTELHTYFDAAPKTVYDDVKSLEDLTPTIELYSTLIGLDRFEDAFTVFRHHLERATLYRLSASRQRVELVERLFPDGVDELPQLESTRDQSYTLNTLAQAYQLGGEPGRAVPLYRRAVEIDEREDFAGGAAVKLCNLSEALRHSGALREAEAAARRGLRLSLEEDADYPKGGSLYLLGLALAACGNEADSEIALRRSLALWQDQSNQQGEGHVNAWLAQRLLWLHQPGAAVPPAGRAWELAHVRRHERDFIRSARLQGAASLGIGDLETAAERLQHTLTRSRAVNLVEEELPALAGLAELHRRNQQFSAARDLLDQVWDLAERGPYPHWHADALNVLAQIERDQGNHGAAIAAAEKACRLAWCDGPPYAYAYALTNAREHLQALNAPEPDLPPFDESRFEPMPDVDFNPKDEFHVTLK